MNKTMTATVGAVVTAAALAAPATGQAVVKAGRAGGDRGALRTPGAGSPRIRLVD